MNPDDYFSLVGESIEFLIAIASLSGLLGIIVGLLIWKFGGYHSRDTGFRVILISGILVAIFGLYTGIKYFRIGIRF
jgi:flagellar biosynthesis protein FliQ